VRTRRKGVYARLLGISSVKRAESALKQNKTWFLRGIEKEKTPDLTKRGNPNVLTYCMGSDRLSSHGYLPYAVLLVPQNRYSGDVAHMPVAVILGSCNLPT